jgi:hypothetical protein
VLDSQGASRGERRRQATCRTDERRKTMPSSLHKRANWETAIEKSKKEKKQGICRQSYNAGTRKRNKEEASKRRGKEDNERNSAAQ